MQVLANSYILAFNLTRANASRYLEHLQGQLATLLEAMLAPLQAPNFPGAHSISLLPEGHRQSNAPHGGGASSPMGANSLRQFSLLRSTSSRTRSIPSVGSDPEDAGPNLLGPGAAHRDNDTKAFGAPSGLATRATPEVPKKTRKGWSAWFGLSSSTRKKEAKNVSSALGPEGVGKVPANSAADETRAAAAAAAAAAAKREQEKLRWQEAHALVLASLEGVNGPSAAEQYLYCRAFIQERRTDIEELILQSERFRTTIVTAGRAGLFDGSPSGGGDSRYGGHPVVDVPAWASWLFGVGSAEGVSGRRGRGSITWDQDLCDDGPRSSFIYGIAAVADAAATWAASGWMFCDYLVRDMIRRNAGPSRPDQRRAQHQYGQRPQLPDVFLNMRLAAMRMLDAIYACFLAPLAFMIVLRLFIMFLRRAWVHGR